MKDTPEQAINEYIKESCLEYYEIQPGFEFRGITIFHNSPMLIGFKLKKSKILLPFIKPCFGPMLIELDADDGEFERHRKEFGSQR